MTDEDRARSAERLLSDPMMIEAFVLVERDAIELMLSADNDQARREGADTVRTVRGIQAKLHFALTKRRQDMRLRPTAV